MDAPTKPKLPDAYADLEVSPAATNAEIKAAFHRLALLHHPDKKAPGEAFDAADFRRVQEAHDLLRDQKEKEHYDKCYSSIRSQWDVYRRECAEYTQDPTTWRRRKAESARAQAEANRRAAEQPRYEFYDTDSDDEYGYGYSPGSGPSFGGGFPGFYDFGLGHGSRPHEPDEWDLEEILFAELLRRSEMYEAAARRNAEERAKNAAVEDINKRCIERLKKAAEAQQAKDDGIRIVDPERKRAMAQSWFINLQRDYNQELQNAGLLHSNNSVMDLGWERKKGRQVCLFCNAQVHEYSYRCPSGGAVACRSCKKEIESSSVNKPFNFYNLGSKKGKSKKAKSAKKSKKAKTRAEYESDLEESESAEHEQGEEQDRGEEAERPLNEEEEAAKQVAEDIARTQEAERQKQERKAEKTRQQAERRAQAKLAREAAEKVAQEKAAKEKAEAKQAARDRAAAQEAARQAAEKKKEAREQEAREKKAVRKKAAKERAALEKAAQREGAQRDAQENDVPKEEVQKAHKGAGREAKQKTEKEVKAKTEQEATERTARQAEEHAIREAQKRAAQDARERAELPEREAKEREVETLAAETKQRAELEAKEAAEHLKREAAKHQVQDSTNANDGKGHKVENEMTGDGKQQVLEPPSATTLPAEPSIANSIAVPKKVKKKATRPPPICYICNKEGHIARNCPEKPAKAVEVTVSQLRTTTEPAMNTEVTSKPPPPLTTAPAKIVVKLPAPREQKIGKDSKASIAKSQESASPSANTSAPQAPAKPSRAPKKKAPRPALPKVPGTNGAATPTPSSINPALVNGTADVPVSTHASKPAKKSKVKGPLTCYVCKEAGHKAKNCPTKTKELMFETVR